MTVSLLMYLKRNFQNTPTQNNWTIVGAIISSDTLGTITRIFSNEISLVCLFSGEFENYEAGREYILRIIRENPTQCPMFEEISHKSSQNVIGFNI